MNQRRTNASHGPWRVCLAIVRQWSPCVRRRANASRSARRVCFLDAVLNILSATNKRVTWSVTRLFRVFASLSFAPSKRVTVWVTRFFLVLLFSIICSRRTNASHGPWRVCFAFVRRWCPSDQHRLNASRSAWRVSFCCYCSQKCVHDKQTRHMVRDAFVLRFCVDGARATNTD